MKTIEELLTQKPVFLGNWKNRENLKKDFNCDLPKNILFAWYDYIEYDRDAFVLVEKDKNLYEVNGSHCSCYGLENQWYLEETSLESLKHRLQKGSFGQDYPNRNTFRKELKEFLGIT